MPTDVNRVMRTILNDWGVMATERGLRLDCRLDYLLPLASAEATLFSQLAINLITNAFNFTSAGGIVRVTTSVQTRDNQPWVTMAVHDTGPGISDQDLPHIFERFYRGEAARQFKAAGTGLGLAICQTIVARLGGLLTVDTQVGLGTTFTVWLQPRMPKSGR
jgi:two-component system sensor histidine kinase BaeS